MCHSHTDIAVLSDLVPVCTRALHPDHGWQGAQGGDGRALDSPLSVALAVMVFALDFLLIALRWFSLEYFFCYGCATVTT